ncbi:MAG: class I SAM-dependent methyltransferase [Elusimicrobiota bacterium]
MDFGGKVTMDFLSRIYRTRFRDRSEYRKAVWRILIAKFFQAYIGPRDAVLDLGCGYGEFINHIRCANKYGMDLNPDSAARLDPSVVFLHQDSAQMWAAPAQSLDVIFTSNFLEHSTSKESFENTLGQAFRCLKPGGLFIAVGPNIKHLPHAYWDFYDHNLPLTELSLSEILIAQGFEIMRCESKFLPYSMAQGPRYPDFLLRLYLAMPLLWKIYGKQFLVIAKRMK